MTAWNSKGKMGKYYSYYGCLNANCLDSEIIPTKTLHSDFKSLLQDITPSQHVLDLANDIFKSLCDEYEQIDQNINKSKKERIKALEDQMKEIE